MGVCAYDPNYASPLPPPSLPSLPASLFPFEADK